MLPHHGVGLRCRHLDGIVGGLTICTSSQSKPWSAPRHPMSASAAAPSSSQHQHAEEQPGRGQATPTAPSAEPLAPYYWLDELYDQDDHEEDVQTESLLESCREDLPLDVVASASPRASSSISTTIHRHPRDLSPLHSPAASSQRLEHPPVLSHCTLSPQLAYHTAAAPTQEGTRHMSEHEQQSAFTSWPHSSSQMQGAQKPSASALHAAAARLSSYAVASAWEVSSKLDPLVHPPPHPYQHVQRHGIGSQLCACMGALEQLAQDIEAPGVAAVCSLDQAAAVLWACGSLFAHARKAEHRLMGMTRRQHQQQQQQAQVRQRQTQQQQQQQSAMHDQRDDDDDGGTEQQQHQHQQQRQLQQLSGEPQHYALQQITVPEMQGAQHCAHTDGGVSAKQGGGYDLHTIGRDLAHVRRRLRSAARVLLCAGPQPWEWAVQGGQPRGSCSSSSSSSSSENAQSASSSRSNGSSSGSGRSIGGSKSNLSSPRALSILLWGLAQMGLRPDIKWLRTYLAHSSTLLLQRRYKPHELSTTLCALAHLKVQPPRAWCRHCTAAAAAPATMAAASQQALANMVWAMAVLKLEPGPGFMEQWYSAFLTSQQQQQQQQQHWQQQQHQHQQQVQYPWGAQASWSSPPSAPPLPTPLYTPQQQAQHLSMALWGLASLEHQGWHTHSKQALARMRPSQAWLAALLHADVPSSTVHTADSPSSAVPSADLPSSAVLTGSPSSAVLADSPSSAVHMADPPSSAALADWPGSTVQLLQLQQGRQLAHAPRSATPQQPLPKAQQQQQRGLQGHHGDQEQGYSSPSHRLAQHPLSHHPDPEPQSILRSETPLPPPPASASLSSRLSCASPQSLANIAWALGELSHTPSPAWTAAFLPAAASAAKSMSPQGACCLLHGLACAGVRAPLGWLTDMTSKLAPGLAHGKYSAGQLVLLLRAVARLQRTFTPLSLHQHQHQRQQQCHHQQSQGGEGVAPAFAAAAMWSANRHMHMYTLHARNSVPSTPHSLGTAAQNNPHALTAGGQGSERKRAHVEFDGQPLGAAIQAASSMSEHPVLRPPAPSVPATPFSSCAPELHSPPPQSIKARMQPGNGRLMSTAQERRLHLLLHSPRRSSTPPAGHMAPTIHPSRADTCLNQLTQQQQHHQHQHQHQHSHTQHRYHQRHHQHRRKSLMMCEGQQLAPEEVQHTHQQQLQQQQQQQEQQQLQLQQQQQQARSFPSSSLLTPTTLAQLMHALVDSGCFCRSPSTSPGPATPAALHKLSLQGAPTTHPIHPARVHTPSTPHNHLSSNASSADSASATADADDVDAGAAPSALPPARWRRACAAALLTALREDAGHGMSAAALAEALPAACAMGVPHTQSRMVRVALHRALSTARAQDALHIAELLLCAASPPNPPSLPPSNTAAVPLESHIREWQTFQKGLSPTSSSSNSIFHHEQRVLPHLANASWFHHAAAFLVQHASLLPSHAIARLCDALPVLAASPVTQGAAHVLSAPVAEAAASKLHVLQQARVVEVVQGLAAAGSLLPLAATKQHPARPGFQPSLRSATAHDHAAGSSLAGLPHQPHHQLHHRPHPQPHPQSHHALLHLASPAPSQRPQALATTSPHTRARRLEGYEQQRSDPGSNISSTFSSSIGEGRVPSGVTAQSSAVGSHGSSVSETGSCPDVRGRVLNGSTSSSSSSSSSWSNSNVSSLPFGSLVSRPMPFNPATSSRTHAGTAERHNVHTSRDGAVGGLSDRSNNSVGGSNIVSSGMLQSSHSHSSIGGIGSSSSRVGPMPHGPLPSGARLMGARPRSAPPASATAAADALYTPTDSELHTSRAHERGSASSRAPHGAAPTTSATPTTTHAAVLSPVHPLSLHPKPRAIQGTAAPHHTTKVAPPPLSIFTSALVPRLPSLPLHSLAALGTALSASSPSSAAAAKDGVGGEVERAVTSQWSAAFEAALAAHLNAGPRAGYQMPATEVVSLLPNTRRVLALGQATAMPTAAAPPPPHTSPATQPQPSLPPTAAAAAAAAAATAGMSSQTPAGTSATSLPSHASLPSSSPPLPSPSGPVSAAAAAAAAGPVAPGPAWMVGWLAVTRWRLGRLQLDALTQALQHVGEVQHALCMQTCGDRDPSYNSSDGDSIDGSKHRHSSGSGIGSSSSHVYSSGRGNDGSSIQIDNGYDGCILASLGPGAEERRASEGVTTDGAAVALTHIQSWVDAAVRAVDAHAAAAHARFARLPSGQQQQQQQQQQLPSQGLQRIGQKVKRLPSPRHFLHSRRALKEAAAANAARTSDSPGTKMLCNVDATTVADAVRDGMQVAASRRTPSSSAPSMPGADADGSMRTPSSSAPSTPGADADGSMRTSSSSAPSTPGADADSSMRAPSSSAPSTPGADADGSMRTPSSSAPSTPSADADAEHEVVLAAGSTVGELICAVGQLHALG
ncbi:hypothetical protein DUNSADRAFT_1819, partial [Dunaliella salina]